MEEKINIIYEDNDKLVIDKLAGWVTTAENNKAEKNIEKWLAVHRKINLDRQGIVHRLDKGTSGVLLVAKTQEALDKYKSLFKKRMVEKSYVALVCGDTSQEGEIKVPIGRSKYVFGKFAVGVDGKTAWTKFKRKEKKIINGKVYSLLDIDLKTGRTHQIRVHMAYMGWPIAGDRLYGGDMILGLNRPYLHAYRLKIDGEEYVSDERVI